MPALEIMPQCHTLEDIPSRRPRQMTPEKESSPPSQPITSAASLKKRKKSKNVMNKNFLNSIQWFRERLPTSLPRLSSMGTAPSTQSSSLSSSASLTDSAPLPSTRRASCTSNSTAVDSDSEVDAATDDDFVSASFSSISVRYYPSIREDEEEEAPELFGQD